MKKKLFVNNDNRNSACGIKRQNPVLRFIILLIIFCPISGFPQVSFDVLLVEGTAKVQRSQKRIWERIQIGNTINDNDLVETFFQTRIIMRFGEKNLIILGSNSKALVNIVQGEKQGTINVNLTLFSGGLFSKTIENAHVNIYTANAVGQIDSGSISAVAESKTGETGFQLLGGSAFIRNIAQQKGLTLRAGLTTMILPNKEPTAPLYITYRHVAVLKHFFGDEYINSELELSGIKPTDEQSGRISLSKSFSNKSAEYRDEGFHRPLFSLDKIFGGILDDRERNSSLYTPIEFPSNLFPNINQVQFTTGNAFTSQGIKPRFQLSVSQKLKIMDVGLRFSVAQNSVSAMQAGFNSLQGLVDKVDHLTLGHQADSFFLSLGPINDYTMGYGLIVKNFSNYNRNNVYQPLGAFGQIGLFGLFKIKAFVSELTLPIIGGAHIGFEPSNYYLGAGYYFDFDHYRQPISSDAFRFSKQNVPDNAFPDKETRISNAHIYNVSFGSNLFSYNDFNLDFHIDFAQKLLNGNDGYVIRLPYFKVEMNRYTFGGGFVVQHGKLLSGQFSSRYLGNRLHLKSTATTFDSDTISTISTQLSKSRRSSGFNVTFNTNPVRGVDIRFEWIQDIVNKNSLADTTDGTDAPGDFTLFLSGRINDSLVPFIKFAELYISQNHGTILPSGSSFFRSWDFETGFFVLTRPLLFNIAFELGGSLFYFDLGSRLNNAVESTDLIFELSGGLRWGFR